jgi:phosphoribosylformylglycinamidine synthase subunit PurL
MEINSDVAQQLGLSEAEFQLCKQHLGRIPNFTELCAFSGMWSEHCSYKNSIRWLKTLPRTGPGLLAAAGEENAGLVDIGDGLACAFKMESHNHPSAIEPYQGAATGVGGINRDIFTMGARPVAQLNALFFGQVSEPRTRWIMDGVVRGIGDYGNAFGVPVVAGQSFFHEAYHQNPLVNAMSVGIVKVDQCLSAKASGVGNPVYIVGAYTGRDGVHGASFASGDLTEDSAKDLPSVQVGDPFMEKCLMEATLETIPTGAIVGIQDMGAAGIICSTSEMSARGQVGMDIYLDLVPTRQNDLQPFELLLSESQERMLVVVDAQKTEDFESVFAKWEVPCKAIGQVTEGGLLRFYFKEEKVAEIPAETLVLGGKAPQYERAFSEPAYFKATKTFTSKAIPEPKDLQEMAKTLLQHPQLASKKNIYRQFDQMVGVATLSAYTPSDAGVIRIPGTDKALAMTVDVNPYYVYAHPELGTEIAVAEAARNLVCSGAKPLAVTNCLNFGNPYDPEAYWQFVGSIKGLSKGCRFYDTPVTGGNVSFYNQFTSEGKTSPVLPTPTIGMIGLIEDLAHFTGLGFQDEGDLILLLGEMTPCLQSSLYLEVLGHGKSSPPPYYDRNKEKVLHKSLLGAIRKGWIKSAHDVSEGGLFTAVLEALSEKGWGCEMYGADALRADAFWFGEGQGRVVISLKPTLESQVVSWFTQQQVPVYFLGKVKGHAIKIDGKDWGKIEDWKFQDFNF